MNEDTIGRLWDESELAEQERRLARVHPTHLADLIRIDAAARALIARASGDVRVGGLPELLHALRTALDES